MRAVRLGLAALLTLSCTVTPVRRYHLGVEVVNDQNRILSVEGRTNLPDGAPIEALLLDPGADLTVSHGRGTVHSSRYFLQLDVSRAPGGERLDLEVRFDPMLAEPSVRRQVGPRGVGMGGELVEEEEDGRTVLVRRVGVVLPMEGREAAMRAVDPSNPEPGIRRMESYVLRNPQDSEAMVRLALVLLAHREPERHPGSRAHALLSRAYDLNPAGDFGSDAYRWNLYLGQAARELEAQRRIQDAMNQADPRRRLQQMAEVLPGEALGAVRLGVPAGTLFTRFWPDRFPSYQGDEVEKIRIRDLQDVEIGVDPHSRLIVSASTRSEFFRLPGN
ncbi:MAG: hypothetical protein AB1758_02665, partial [Candidatus Eremiobacterota bacterium]